MKRIKQTDICIVTKFLFLYRIRMKGGIIRGNKDEIEESLRLVEKAVQGLYRGREPNLLGLTCLHLIYSVRYCASRTCMSCHCVQWHLLRSADENWPQT
jgi:hypothetical protein